MTVKNYVLDINKTSLQHPSIVLRQDDYNIYTINISVTDNGTPVDLGSYTLNFLGITPAGAKIIDSKNFITNAGDLKNGKFSYKFPKEAAGSKGVYDVAYFRLKTTSGATSTIDLNLRVLGGIDLTADEVKDYITVDDTLRNTLVSEVFKKVDAKVDEHLATVKKGDKGDTGPAGKDGYMPVIGGRNLYLGSKVIKDKYGTNNGATVTVEPNNSDTNIWHKVSAQGKGGIVGIYLSGYANGKIPNNSDWCYSVDIKGTGEVSWFGIEISEKKPIKGAVGSNWSRIIQIGHVNEVDNKGVVMYFDTYNSPLDVYIKLPKLERGNVATDWTPAPEDVPSNDAQLVHKAGNETLSGDKTLVGNTNLATTTMLAGNYGLRVTTSGFQKTTDGGGTWVKGDVGATGPKGESYNPNINQRLDRFANNFHLNNPINTSMNDIQTGFWDGSKWHLYYLYNSDVSWGGNGTEWYHVTTTDWVNFNNEGVAVKKYKTEYGDVATGTMWEDTDNIVGKGAGTKFAMATGYGGDKGQNTMLYYSTDGGYNYSPYQNTPIMTHPDGQEDFRDPFLFRMDGKFIVYHAENNKFGVYVSDKINEGYVYKGAYSAPHPTLECPNLFVMNVNGDTNNKKWVCIYSGNGGDDMQTGMYASVGSLDDNYVFKPEQEDIRIDWGPDFYAAKPFTDITQGDVNASVLMVGWLGSWGYVGDVPRETRQGVGASTCRRVKLEYTDGKYDIKSDILGVDNYLENPVIGNNLKSNTNLPIIKGDSFYLKIRFKDMMSYKGNVSVKFVGNEYDTTFTYDSNNKNILVHRYNSQFTDNAIFSKDHTFPVKTEDLSDIWLEFYVDRVVIESKTPDRKTYTMTKFPIGASREAITVSSSADCNFDYEYYQISKEGNSI